MVLRQSRSSSFWRLAVILGAVLLAIASSRPRKGDGQTMTGSQVAHKDNCRLAVESRIEGQNVLVVQYNFQNDAGRDVYVFNRLYKEIVDGPVFDTDTNLVNVENLAKGILLSKKIIAVPPDIDVEKPSLPCSSLVKTGGRLSETIRLSLPLSVWTPYVGHTAKAPPTDVVRRRALFEIGYFVSNSGTQSLAQVVQTKQGEAFYFDPFPETGQKTIEVELPMEVPILGKPHG